jgi:hypothetical protein
MAGRSPVPGSGCQPTASTASADATAFSRSGIPNAESLPCIVCRKRLEDVFEGPTRGNQPYAGLEFLGYGHYGCTIFDMEPGQLIVNICDDCLTLASADSLVRHRLQTSATDRQWLSPKASRIEARSDETLQVAQPEGQEPDGEAGTPNPGQSSGMPKGGEL